MIYDALTGKLLIAFDTYIENTYNNQNGIAFEPLENGSFSSDSKQITPEIISITGIKSIPVDTTKSTVDKFRQTLISLNKADTLLIIILQIQTKNKTSQNSQWWQYTQTYNNFCMFNLEWQNNPEQLELRALMTFQQIRLTNTEYTQQQNVANVQDSAPANAGQVQAKQDSSILYNNFGVVRYGS